MFVLSVFSVQTFVEGIQDSTGVHEHQTSDINELRISVMRDRPRSGERGSYWLLRGSYGSGDRIVLQVGEV